MASGPAHRIWAAVAESFRSPPRPRRRVSRRRYVVRRIVAGTLAVAVLLGGGFGIVKAVGALGGGSGGEVAGSSLPPTSSSTAAAATTAPATAPPPTPAGIVGPVPSTAPPSIAAPTTAAPVVPSAEHPAKVLVVGDSDAGTFGPYLEKLLDGTGVVATTVDYKVSSGLARPDFFDWPAHLQKELPTAAPDIVVVTFGGNDAQGLSNRDGSNPSEWNDPVGKQDTWTAEYSQRAGAAMDLLAAGGRTVVWVGIPNDDNSEVTARLKVQDQAVRAALAARPGVQFVDTWALFSSVNGGWAEYVIDPRDGEGKDVRASDGFHLNETGAEILAVRIDDVVETDLKARGAAI
jgi:uncharacterized protein